MIHLFICWVVCFQITESSQLSRSSPFFSSVLVLPLGCCSLLAGSDGLLSNFNSSSSRLSSLLGFSGICFELEEDWVTDGVGNAKRVVVVGVDVIERCGGGIWVPESRSSGYNNIVQSDIYRDRNRSYIK